MTKEIELLKKKADNANNFLHLGAISLSEAKEDIMPYIEAINRKAKEKSLKFKVSPRYISFSGFTR